MNIWKLGSIAAVCSMIIFAGCRSEVVPPPPVPPVTEQMERSAAELTAAWQKETCRGIVLGAADFRFYSSRGEVLLDRLGKLGVNRLYVTIPSVEEWEVFEFQQAFQALLTAAAPRQLAVEAYLEQQRHQH